MARRYNDEYTTKKERLLGEKKEKLSFNFLDSLNFYTRLISEKTTGGLTDTPEFPLGENQFYYASDRIFTKKGVKKIYFIKSFPDTIRRGFVTDIRHAVNKDVISYNNANGVNERTDVGLILDGKHFSLNLGDRRIRGRWEYFTRQYESVQRKAGQKTLQDELKSDKYSEAVRRKVSSFLYIKEGKDEQDSCFYKTTVVLEFIATSNDVLTVAENAFKNYISNSKLVVKPIFIQTPYYQKSYMPVSNVQDTYVKKENKGSVFTDDILSSFSMTTHGIVGDKLGIYHGIDIESNLPVTFDFSKGSDANNILLVGKSGEGKSNMAKMIYTFTIPLDDVYRTIVLDYEGEQFEPIGILANASIVSVGTSEGRYVNTMAIGDLTGNPKIDSGLKIQAVEATKRVFNILVNENYGMDSYQMAIFSDALNDIYLDFGVTEEPETWYKSKEITFFHIYSKILTYKNNNAKIRLYELDNINRFLITLRPFFEKGGAYKHWFKEPISIQEIKDSKHLIFDFGMKGQDESKTDGKHLAIRQMFVSYLVNLLSAHNRAQNLRTVIFVEEMQRYIKQRFSGEILAGMSSGGRKLGMIVYYITNSPRELISLSDSGMDENIGTSASTIISNISMQIIGALYKSDMDLLINEYGLENARGILYELANVVENGGNSRLKYCFFTKYKNQATIVRTLSHPALEDTPLYSTLTDADSNIEYEQDGKLKINVGEDSIKAKIQMAHDEHMNRSEDDNTWSKIVEQYNDSRLWKN